MPELPEVEIVKNGLKNHFQKHSQIEEVLFLRPNIRNPLPLKKIKSIFGQTVLSVERRAKYILIEIGDSYIVSHLGMTGAWRVENSSKNKKLHDHVILRTSSKSYLIYNDPRRFGVFDLVKKHLLSQDKRFLNLGVEPLTLDFNALYLLEKAQNKITTIKQFIMDQRIVVGVGNIYASEALFDSKVSPLIQAKDLKKEILEELVISIRRTLEHSLKAGGSSISDYSSVDQKKGSYQDNHQVYGKKDQPCPKCSHPIFMQVIAGRSTFWCVKCQKTPRKKQKNETPKTYNTRKNSKTTPRTQRS